MFLNHNYERIISDYYIIESFLKKIQIEEEKSNHIFVHENCAIYHHDSLAFSVYDYNSNKVRIIGSLSKFIKLFKCL